MQRVGFKILVRPEKLAEYKRLHNPIWPELQAELKKAGIRNYTLWLDEKEAQEFGYLECDDWTAACAYLEKSEVHTRWQVLMQDYLRTPMSGDQAGQPVVMLERVMLLD